MSPHPSPPADATLEDALEDGRDAFPGDTTAPTRRALPAVPPLPNPWCDFDPCRVECPSCGALCIESLLPTPATEHRCHRGHRW